jgi:hypothetical protein
MKKQFTLACLAVSLICNVAVMVTLLARPVVTVKAQAPTVGSFASPMVVSSLSGCTLPTGATISFGVAWCFVDTGVAATSQMYFSLNGSTTWNPYPAAGGGAFLTSFNGRTTPAAVPTLNDYSYSMLSGPPTTLACSTAQISSGSSGTLTASGCVIK